MVDGPLGHEYSVADIDINGIVYCSKAVTSYWRRQNEKRLNVEGNKLCNNS